MENKILKIFSVVLAIGFAVFILFGIAFSFIVVSDNENYNSIRPNNRVLTSTSGTTLVADSSILKGGTYIFKNTDELLTYDGDLYVQNKTLTYEIDPQYYGSLTSPIENGYYIIAFRFVFGRNSALSSVSYLFNAGNFYPVYVYTNSPKWVESSNKLNVSGDISVDNDLLDLLNWLTDGYEATYNQGYEDGYNQGYEDGEEYGYNKGYGNGYENGHNIGSGEGYELGYNAGYSNGYNMGLTNSIENPVSFILSPVNDFMNIKLFGVVSLGGVFAVVLFVALALIFLKLFAGG